MQSARIQPLPQQLADQIAAGEVIERPSSVVKELLENSLDAGSTRIEITIDKGGMEKIVIVDNGGGIYKEDLPLAVSRHATSKIKTLNDLEALYTLGFRGEALASVASISRLRIASKPIEADQAWQLAVTGRDQPLIEVTPVGHPTGTTIWIEQLFYNTPARRKFLKSERTEFEHIEEVVRRISLSRYDVGFVLKHNQRVIFQLPAIENNQPLNRIKKIFGAAFTEQIIECQAAAVGITLQGWVGNPTFHRSQNDLQYFYVNGRIIRDRVITHAVHQAYSEVVPIGRYPAYILYLTIGPEQVDVNVHPTKHEVRFRQARWVHDFIVTQLREMLATFKTTSVYAPEKISATAIKQQQAFYTPAPLATTQAQSMEDLAPKVRETFTQSNYTPVPFQVDLLRKIANSYLLCDHPQLGVILVDVHAAFASLAREHLTNNPQAQTLLLPETILINALDLTLLEEHQDELQKLGFEYNCLGEQHLVLRSVPAVLRYAAYPSLIYSIIKNLREADQPLIETLACLAKPVDLNAVDVSFLNAVLAFIFTGSLQKVCGHRRQPYIDLDEEKLDKLIKT